MSSLTVAPVTGVDRPKRWDEAFGAMSEADVAEMLERKPFCDFDRQRFRVPLDGILKNDARLREFEPGDIVMREGDYGTSAFLVLEGSVRVFLENLPAEKLGRRPEPKRSPWQIVSQLWNRSRYPEARTQVRSEQTARLNRSPRGNTANIYIQDVPENFQRYDSTVRHEGELIGELAALSRTPRTATIVADAPARLLEIRWQGLRDIRKYAPAWKDHIDQLFRERSLAIHLRKSEMLANLDDDALDLVMKRTEFETFGRFDWYDNFKKIQESSTGQPHALEPKILSEGDYPNGLVLVRNGFVRVSHRYNHGERTVSYLGKGQTYGMHEIFQGVESGEPMSYQHTLRALGYVDVLVIPTAVVEQVIIPSLSPQQKESLLLDPFFRPDIHSQAGLPHENVEFLVENRFINGTAAMLIDLDRCTRCDDCVRACAATHDANPRFIRQGIQNGSTMFANACMHCSDPVCMIGCPTGAIHREPNTGVVVINDLTCIGCETCANSCPYNNIHMVEVRTTAGEIMFGEDDRPILKATKCDLCSEQITGPSCERACPHDALIRMDLREPETLSRWLNR